MPTNSLPIQSLIASALLAEDQRDRPTLETCFAAAAKLEYADENGVVATASQRAAVVAALCRGNTGVIHFAPAIDVLFEDVNFAKASYTVFLASTGVNPRPPTAQIYSDQLQRIDGMWRIVKRRVSASPADALLLLEALTPE